MLLERRSLIILMIISSSWLIPNSCKAKNLGVLGATFPIHEPSLLEIIQTKLRALESTDTLLEHQKEIQDRVKRSIERPKSGTPLETATVNQSRTYDPTIIMDEDIKDHQGHLIVRKGISVNPLDYHSFGKPLILINGDDPVQLHWALKQEGKIVLTQGAPLQLSNQHKIPIYFDQGGVLVRKFSISKVPSRVSQKDTLLEIEEIKLAGENER